MIVPPSQRALQIHNAGGAVVEDAQLLNPIENASKLAHEASAT